MGLFQPATETAPRLRMAFVGTAGSGKTFSMLQVGTDLANRLGRGRVAVIDTEHGSSAKYRKKFRFDILNLNQFDPRNYIEAIQAAEAEGYDVLGIDSLSHAWFGKGGELELVDKAAKKSQSKNTYFAWRDVTPLHNALVDCILQSNCHIIATMRSKTDYDQQTDPNTGKIKPVKIGLAPVMREGMDFEFDIVGDIDTDHSLTISKTRCEALDGQVIFKPGRQLAHTLVEWLTDGTGSTESPATVIAASASTLTATAPVSPATPTAPAAPAAQAAPSAPAQSDMPSNDLIRLDEVARLSQLIVETATDDFQVRGMLARRGVSAINRLLREDALEIIAKLESFARQLQAERDIEAARTITAPTMTPTTSEPTTSEPDSVVDNIMASIQAGSPVTADTVHATHAGRVDGDLISAQKAAEDALDFEQAAEIRDRLAKQQAAQRNGGATELATTESIGTESAGTESATEDDVVIADVTRPEPKPKETKPRKSKKGDAATSATSTTDTPTTSTLEESMAAL